LAAELGRGLLYLRFLLAVRLKRSGPRPSKRTSAVSFSATALASGRGRAETLICLPNGADRCSSLNTTSQQACRHPKSLRSQLPRLTDPDFVYGQGKSCHPGFHRPAIRWQESRVLTSRRALVSVCDCRMGPWLLTGAVTVRCGSGCGRPPARYADRPPDREAARGDLPGWTCFLLGAVTGRCGSVLRTAPLALR